MKRNNRILLILGILFVLNLLAWGIVYDKSKPNLLEVTFFDVGQGDSIFIETPNGFQILIDGGPDSTVLEKLGNEMPFYDRTIDLVILSHPEHDHFAGLFHVLERYEIKYILWTGIVRDTDEYREWERLIEKEGAEITIAQAGQRITLGEATDIKILFPFENLKGEEIQNSNNTSIVNLLTFGEVSFLFTGDISKSTEKDLIEKNQDLKADVLKIAHHGSKTSNSEEFIGHIFPDIAVISVGKDNHYGHPNPEILEILERYGITVLRTDQDGDIKIISDGTTYERYSIPGF